VNSFKDKKVKRFCIECGAVFLPMRIKEENKYCGEVCSKRVRNRNFRAKKKVSASKAGSKATPKARKEKK
jgi:DNA-directed RNA polymerase subunit M/transcription elongation factor TFIIS